MSVVLSHLVCGTFVLEVLENEMEVSVLPPGARASLDLIIYISVRLSTPQPF